MKVKKMIELLNTFDPEAEVAFKLDNDTYAEKDLEIFDILESRLRDSDIHIVLEIQG